jgi:SAM-dependent methyltransferase
MASRPPACPLCGHRDPAPLLECYFHCPQCDLRFLNPERRLGPEAEKARYSLHNNSFGDPRYREFLYPLAEAVRLHLEPPAQGLDYGCGKAAVLAEILRDMGYIINIYDPYFADCPEALTCNYNLICASEVVEHFYNPGLEFKRLRQLLRPGGILAIMTAIYDDKIDFGSWYYRRDPTHVAFYSSMTFVCLAKQFGFEVPYFHGDRIVVLRDTPG